LGSEERKTHYKKNSRLGSHRKKEKKRKFLKKKIFLTPESEDRNSKKLAIIGDPYLLKKKRLPSATITFSPIVDNFPTKNHSPTKSFSYHFRTTFIPKKTFVPKINFQPKKKCPLGFKPSEHKHTNEKNYTNGKTTSLVIASKTKYTTHLPIHQKKKKKKNRFTPKK
jgi:hypothetical protein